MFFEDHEEGEYFRCIGCKGGVTASPPALPPVITLPVPRQRPAVPVGVIAVVAACAGCFSCFGCLLYGALLRPNSTASNLSNQGAARSKPFNDPYSPDCAIIRTWLKANYGEVEVVSWGHRTISHNLQLGGSVTLSVRFRVKGERGTKSGFFIIGPGDIVESSTISD
jgi:hypothetical protein